MPGKTISKGFGAQLAALDRLCCDGIFGPVKRILCPCDFRGGAGMVVYLDGIMGLNFLVDWLLLLGVNRISGFPPGFGTCHPGSGCRRWLRGIMPGSRVSFSWFCAMESGKFGCNEHGGLWYEQECHSEGAAVRDPQYGVGGTGCQF